MAEGNAQFLQIGLGHIWQDFEIDGILGKGGRVLGEPNPIKPGFYLVIVTHCRVCPPKVLLHFPFKFTPHIALRARAASGQAAAPPRSVMNARRLIRSPRLRERAAAAALRGPAFWRSGVYTRAGLWAGPARAVRRVSGLGGWDRNSPPRVGGGRSCRGRKRSGHRR